MCKTWVGYNSGGLALGFYNESGTTCQKFISKLLEFKEKNKDLDFHPTGVFVKNLSDEEYHKLKKEFANIFSGENEIGGLK